MCGDDGKTYDDICHLMARSCVNKAEIKFAYSGQCGRFTIFVNAVCASARLTD